MTEALRKKSFVQVHGEDYRGYITKYKDFDSRHTEDAMMFTKYLLNSEENKTVIIKKFEEK